jgi:hypothetical protein
MPSHLFHLSQFVAHQQNRWSQLNNMTAISSPPARSHACSTLLNHFIIIHGGRCSNNSLCNTWMFNTVSNEWSPLLSAKTQQQGEIPSPRWGHGCVLMPTPGVDSSLASSLYLFGGISTDSVGFIFVVRSARC